MKNISTKNKVLISHIYIQIETSNTTQGTTISNGEKVMIIRQYTFRPM